MKIILGAISTFSLFFLINKLNAQCTYKVVVDTIVVSHFGYKSEEASVERSYSITSTDYYLFNNCRTDSCKKSILDRYPKRSIRLFEEKDTKRLVPLDQCLSFKIGERVFESGPESVVYSLDRKEFSPSCIGKIKIKSFCNNITFKVVKINLFYKKNLIATHFISDLNNLNSEFYDDLKYSYYLQFVVNNGTEDIVFNKFFLGAIENINSSQLIDFR